MNKIVRNLRLPFSPLLPSYYTECTTVLYTQLLCARGPKQQLRGTVLSRFGKLKRTHIYGTEGLGPKTP